MSDLLVGEALTLIERALRNKIRRGLAKRQPTVATVAALRAVASQGASATHSIPDGALRYVTAAGVCYEFSWYSQTADNGSSVIKPTDAGTAGRWLSTTSTATSGYLRDVILYAGEFSDEEIESRLFGLKPCVVIHFNGAEHEVKSVRPGALYRYRPRFVLWAVSENMRPGFEGAIGSAISSEATADPGAFQIVGDLKQLLAGDDLDQDGIDYCEIGDEDVILASMSERKFVASLALTVNATIHNPEDPDELVDVDGLNVQRQLADAHGEDEHDHDNYMVGPGILVATGSGLTQAISAGTAYVDGTAVAYLGESKTFTAERDTYRDLNPDATLTFVEVTNGADEPEVTSGALRIGVTVTDASDVVSDTLLVSTLEDVGDVDEIPQ